MGCPKERATCKFLIFSGNAGSSLLIFFEYMGMRHLEVMDDIQQELSRGNYGASSLMNSLWHQSWPSVISGYVRDVVMYITSAEKQVRVWCCMFNCMIEANMYIAFVFFTSGCVRGCYVYNKIEHCHYNDYFGVRIQRYVGRYFYICYVSTSLCI